MPKLFPKPLMATAFLIFTSYPVIAEEAISLDVNNATSENILDSFLKSSTKVDADEDVSVRGIRLKSANHTNQGCNFYGGGVSLQIKFASNSYKLEPEGIKALDKVAVAIQSPELKNCSFLVEGHTDASGEAEYNRNLSDKRARTVKQYLVKQNINADQLKIAGLGEERLLNTSQPYAAENRRVEFKLISN